MFSTVCVRHRPPFSTALCSARSSVFSTVQCVLSTVQCVEHSPVCSELFSTMQLRRSDRQLRRPSPLHCCLTPGRRIFSFQLKRNQILRILASLTGIGLFSLQIIELDLFFILLYQVTFFCKLSNLIPILHIRSFSANHRTIYFSFFQIVVPN